MINVCEKSDLVGTWELLSYRIFNAENILQPEDNRIVGRLLYSQNDTMAVVITKGPDATSVLSDVIAYSGIYRIVGNHIEHIIEVSNINSFHNSVQIREINFKGKILELSTVGRSDGRHSVQWRKI